LGEIDLERLALGAAHDQQGLEGRRQRLLQGLGGVIEGDLGLLQANDARLERDVLEGQIIGQPEGPGDLPEGSAVLAGQRDVHDRHDPDRGLRRTSNRHVDRAPRQALLHPPLEERLEPRELSRQPRLDLTELVVDRLELDRHRFARHGRGAAPEARHAPKHTARVRCFLSKINHRRVPSPSIDRSLPTRSVVLWSFGSPATATRPP